MDINRALNKLYSLQKFGMKFGLSKTKKLLHILGDPHKKLKCFHVAGSNGKGSVSSFIASILFEAGYKTGLYTSPHLVKFNERVRINGIQIEDDYIVEFISRITSFIDSEKPTFFEASTALAFNYFYENNVDYAVIETGLGGRLDSTNVITPLASVITSISLEHTEILGGTIEKIAVEKAGIIKKDCKVFLGNLSPKAIAIFKNKSLLLNNDFYEIDKYLLKDQSDYFIKFNDEQNLILDIPLKGNFQIYNAGLAVLTVMKTLNIPDIKNFELGMKNVLMNSGLEGRYEIFCDNPLVILDVAHNIEGINCFLESFYGDSKSFNKKVVLFGAMKDKPIKEMLGKLKKYFDDFYFLEIDCERCEKADMLVEKSAKLGIKGKKIDAPASFIIDFINNRRDDCLAFVGSVYILGKIKSDLMKIN